MFDHVWLQATWAINFAVCFNSQRPHRGWGPSKHRRRVDRRCVDRYRLDSDSAQLPGASGGLGVQRTTGFSRENTCVVDASVHELVRVRVIITYLPMTLSCQSSEASN